ncbi:MAG TPA: U32 family peptidase [Deltaproteobacteria bacterium]|nr:U32 family peptidase [Deltaproteobacteria bacterium]
MRKPEILAPAGSMETLRTACLYGADAVYLGVRGGTNLREGAKNFSIDELPLAVSFAHACGVRVYLTLNTYPHDGQLPEIEGLIRSAEGALVDAVIVSDLGVLSLVRKLAPSMAVHLSTQANTVNTAAVNAWADLGVSRIILARELSCEEIARIRAGSKIELEIFIHGSVCISVSGRCLISDYLCGRDANRGRCAQPCRWDYALMERTREGRYMPIAQEEGFTFLFNSKDLCLLPVFDRVMGLGLDGLKIEGRNKAPLYVATAVSVYRQARDEYLGDPGAFSVRPGWEEEIGRISNRGYFTGFFTGKPGPEGINGDCAGYVQTHHLAAKVLEANGGITLMEARNPLIEGMELEWLSSSGARQTFCLQGASSDGKPVSRIRPNQVFSIETPFRALPGELVRKRYSEGDKIVPGRE